MEKWLRFFLPYFLLVLKKNLSFWAIECQKMEWNHTCKNIKAIQERKRPLAEKTNVIPSIIVASFKIFLIS